MLGGFIGRARDVGVPGHDGTGLPMALLVDSFEAWDRKPRSGGAGTIRGDSSARQIHLQVRSNLPGIFVSVIQRECPLLRLQRVDVYRPIRGTESRCIR